MSQLTALGERFGYYLKYSKIGINQAGRELGVSGAQVSNITKGKNFSVSILLKIFNTYSDLCLDWLVLGEGQMLCDPSQDKQTAQYVSEDTSPAYDNSYQKKYAVCRQECERLQTQVETYQDALDRLGGKTIRG